MRLLITDLLRRKYWWITPLLAVALVPAWWVGDADHTAKAFAFSMGMAFAVGPQLLNPSLLPRVIWYLPISRRDVWRASWLLATVGATSLTTSAKLIGILMPSAGSFTLPMLVLSSLYDFAYTGFGCALIIIATRPRPAGEPWRRIWPFLKGAAEFTLPFGVLAAMFGSYVVGRALPLHWAEMTARGGTVLAAALALSIATYFHAADPIAPSIFWASRHHTKTTTSRVGRIAGLTGLRRLLAHEYAWSTLLAGCLVVAFGALVFVAGALTHSSGPYGGFLEMQSLLLFDDALASERGKLFDLIIWCGLFAAALLSRFPNILRHLRVLPVAASRLNLLLVAWPALMLLTVWVGLVGLHYLVLGRPVASLQPALLVALIGSSAIARATKLRWLWSAPLLGTLWLCTGPVLRLLNGPSSAALVVLGLGGIAAAAALNHFTLMRSATYRGVSQGFGAVPARPWS